MMLGLFGIACYLGHAVHQLLFDFPLNLIWYCHLGALISGLGLLVRSPAINGLGLCWLAVGTPTWLIGLLLGITRFLPTSPLTHLGGLAVAFWGARRLGMPAGVWWKAATAMVALYLVTSPFNPPGKHVNFTGGLALGVEDWFSSYPVFLLTMLAVCAGAFWLLERNLRPES